MDDEPMWAADCVVAQTLGSAITIPETANKFVIKCNHLTLVKGNQFDGIVLGEDATREIPNMGFNLVDVEGELTLSSLDVLQGFSFFLQMGFTLILATLDGLDVGLLGDVIGEDDCDDDG
ncbi:hypothetical protein Tco_0794324 [Tanacetum coccineum]